MNLSKEKLSSKLKVFGLRSADSIQQRSWFIQETIKANADEIGIVFIDGIRDLLYDINDSSQAIKTVTDFMALSAIYSLHIQNTI